MADNHKIVKKNRVLRGNRVRARLHGTVDRPRLSVVVSNTHVSAQIINDDEGKTLASASSIGSKMTGTMTEKATKVGEMIVANAKKAKISKVAFDRSHKQYHGRIQAFAESARKNGLEF